MPRSERINLLVSPEEKAALDARAKQSGLTTSELVRRAIVAFDPMVDLEELKALAEELAGVANRMEQSLDASLEAIAALRKQLADKDAMEAEAIAELKASGDIWPFALPEAADHGEAAV